MDVVEHRRPEYTRSRAMADYPIRGMSARCEPACMNGRSASRDNAVWRRDFFVYSAQKQPGALCYCRLLDRAGGGRVHWILNQEETPKYSRRVRSYVIHS
jgi:hypothetical protein